MDGMKDEKCVSTDILAWEGWRTIFMCTITGSTSGKVKRSSI